MANHDSHHPPKEDLGTEDLGAHYEPPELSVIGTVEELTLGGSGSSYDGAEFASGSG